MKFSLGAIMLAGAFHAPRPHTMQDRAVALESTAYVTRAFAAAHAPAGTAADWIHRFVERVVTRSSAGS